MSSLTVAERPASANIRLSPEQTHRRFNKQADLSIIKVYIVQTDLWCVGSRDGLGGRLIFSHPSQAFSDSPGYLNSQQNRACLKRLVTQPIT
jgi:hypothetical protein